MVPASDEVRRQRRDVDVAGIGHLDGDAVGRLATRGDVIGTDLQLKRGATTATSAGTADAAATAASGTCRAAAAAAAATAVCSAITAVMRGRAARCEGNGHREREDEAKAVAHGSLPADA